MLPNVEDLVFPMDWTKEYQRLLHLGNGHSVWISFSPLSKRPSQLKLDSLLQEVCIDIEQLNHNCPFFFRANESLLNSWLCTATWEQMNIRARCCVLGLLTTGNKQCCRHLMVLHGFTSSKRRFLRNGSLSLVGKWADPGGTAMPGQLVTEPEQAPELYPLTKISLISKRTHGPRIRY